LVFFMREQLEDVGKIRADVFDRTIFPRLGSPRSDVLVGPRHGVDVGIIDIGAGRVMAVTTDPFFVAPEYGWERAGWFAVQIVLSDVATSGLKPTHLAVDLNLPLSTSDGDLAALWQAVHEACVELEVSIVTGHTGRYEGCSFPTVGAATGIAFGGRDEYVLPSMARPGDAVIITKGPAIETTALLGMAAPRTIAGALGVGTAQAAAALFRCMTVVPDAMVAIGVGAREAGVTSMHDATERGVIGGLVEIAETSGNGVLVDLDAMRLRPEVRAVSELFEVDPYSTSSEGTLLLTCRPHRCGDAIARLEAAGIDTFHVGEILPPGSGMWLVSGGHEQPMTAPDADPFWPAYRRALEQERT
jgi:hydrogenase maturation factor